MKTIVFVDAAQYRPTIVTHRLSTKLKFDWIAFVNWLADIADEVAGKTSQDGLFDVHYFDSTTEALLESKESFHAFLRSTLSFQLHMTSLSEKYKRCPACKEEYSESEQKGVDVGIAISMMKLAYNGAYDQAILCSGDGDFAGLTQFIRDSLGKRVIVVGWHNGIAPILRDVAYRTFTLNDHSDKFLR